MSSPVILSGLALLDLRRRANEEETRRRRRDEDVGHDDDGSSSSSDDDENDEREDEAGPHARADGNGRENARGSDDGRTREAIDTVEGAMGERSRSSSGTTSSPAMTAGAGARAEGAEGAADETPTRGDADDADADEQARNEIEGEERTRLCRFCFTGSECGRLIEPCACSGSQRFVHKKCLRRWWRVSYHTRGQRETTCRVCHVKYSYESSRIGRRRDELAWFSLRARDRLNEYCHAWFQSAANALLRRRGVRLPRSASSAGNLALLVAHSEVRIWAGREERRHGMTSGLPKLLRVASFLFRAASSYAKLRLLLSPNNSSSSTA